MARDDQSSRSLLGPRSDESRMNERQFRKWLVLIGWILLLFGMLIVMIGIRKVYRGCKEEENVNGGGHGVWPSRGINLTAVSFPRNLTEFFLKSNKLCETVSAKGSVEDGDYLSRVYVVKGDKNLTESQACGLESILRLFPDKTVYLIDFNKNGDQEYDKCRVPPNFLGLLRLLYGDRLRVLQADKAAFFKDTPLQNVTKTDENLSFLAMLLTAYKYGGFVTTPSIVMTNRELIECFPEETVVEPFAIFSSQRCDDYLHYLMESFGLCDHRINASLDEILTQTSDLFSRDQTSRRNAARRLTPGEMNSDVDDPCTFLKPKECKKGSTRWVSDLAPYCKQVVQAHLGIAINRMEVEAETKEMKSLIIKSRENLVCSSYSKLGKSNNREDCD